MYYTLTNILEMLHTHATQISALQTSVAEWFILFIQCFHCDSMMAELCDKSRCQVPRELFTTYQQTLFRIHPADVTQECVHHNDRPDGREKPVWLRANNAHLPHRLNAVLDFSQHNTGIRAEHHPSRWLQAPKERWMPRLPTTVVACSLSMWAVNSIVSDSQV